MSLDEYRRAYIQAVNEAERKHGDACAKLRKEKPVDDGEGSPDWNDAYLYWGYTGVGMLFLIGAYRLATLLGAGVAVVVFAAIWIGCGIWIAYL